MIEGLNRKQTLVVIGATLFGVCYNGLLALANAHLFSVPNALTILCELSVLAIIAVIIANNGLQQRDKTSLGLLISIIVTFVMIKIGSGVTYLDTIRNGLIIGLFFIVGQRLQTHSVRKLFSLCTLLVLAVLLLEVLYLQGYVQLLQPARYFAQVKGMEVQELNDVGVFGAALGYANRFSFGVFDGPRTSSLFLEQVSLGNFASILFIYLLTVDGLSRRDKLLGLATVALIILSSNSRFGFGILLLFTLIKLVKVPLPPFSNFYGFTLLIFGGIVYATTTESLVLDTLSGRIHHGFESLSKMGPAELFGFSAHDKLHYADAGLAYSTITFGVFSLCFILGLLLFAIEQHQLRYAQAALFFTLYFLLNLIISGTSVYSMKTAPLFWLLLGHITTQSQGRDAYEHSPI